MHLKVDFYTYAVVVRVSDCVMWILCTGGCVIGLVSMGFVVASSVKKRIRFV